MEDAGYCSAGSALNKLNVVLFVFTIIVIRMVETGRQIPEHLKGQALFILQASDINI